MTTWFNRQTNEFEIYHNGRLVDHAKSQAEANEKIKSYNQLHNSPPAQPRIVVASQDKGKAHCHYIRQLAQEIWFKENEGVVYTARSSWDDCMKKALALHVKKLKALTGEGMDV